MIVGEILQCLPKTEVTACLPEIATSVRARRLPTPHFFVSMIMIHVYKKCASRVSQHEKSIALHLLVYVLPPVSQVSKPGKPPSHSISTPSKMSSPPALNTPLTKLLGIKYPIMLAGMARTSGGPLAAAVSNAGGIGTIGGLGYTPQQLQEVSRAPQSSPAHHLL